MSRMHKQDAAPTSVQRMMDAIAGCEASADELREMIAAALADAERKGAEAMREASAAMPEASASRLMQAKRVPMVDQHCAGILRDHADKIRALPLPTGSQS